MAKYDAYAIEKQEQEAALEEQHRLKWRTERAAFLVNELWVNEKLALYLADQEWVQRRTTDRLLRVQLEHATF